MQEALPGVIGIIQNEAWKAAKSSKMTLGVVSGVSSAAVGLGNAFLEHRVELFSTNSAPLVRIWAPFLIPLHFEGVPTSTTNVCSFCSIFISLVYLSIMYSTSPPDECYTT